ncbi:hypothetical protein GCM10008959_39260 [Deinococcus seoulensis]|uniref:Uncharacterized protein n=1 Tax=Deinococcus seoulensis TaxID=1837379 RepID=A0ABQ2RWE6_9DEIO|nr:hypothetical protein [Deinococcus seoulensis]GGR74162.1 hypothetical protein GCM10008959_39260 [Deinococcus seoulensis]
MTVGRADLLPAASAGPDEQQLAAFRALSWQRDEAAAHLAACREALVAWAGPDVAFAGLLLLNSAELPGAVAAAVWRQQDTGSRSLSLQQELTRRQERRAQRTADLAVVTAQRTAHERESGYVKALAALQPSADQLNTVRARLAQALTRLAGLQGRGLATLWSAVSGQASALQREVDQARQDEVSALQAYEARARQVGALPVPDAAGVAGQVAREQSRLNEQGRELARQQHAILSELSAMDSLDEGTNARIRTLRQRAAAAWESAQKVHALPAWDRWVHLWRRREDARPLWERHADAERRLEDATGALEGHLATFPAHLRDPVDVKRQLGALEEAARTRRQAAREQVERHAWRAALLWTLQGRAAALETARIHEARLHEERERQRAAEAERLREAQRIQEAERIREAQAARRHEGRLAFLGTLQERRAALTAAQRHAEEASGVGQGGAQVLAPGSAQEERGAAGGAPGASAPAAPVPPAAPHVREPEPREPSPVASAPVRLEGTQLADAKALLVRHAGAAAQAAMCLEALVEWAGAGVDALRLAELVTRPLPAGMQDLVAAWNARPATSGAETTPPVTRAEDAAAWLAFRATLDVPVTLDTWCRLWTAREKGMTFWRQWQGARDTMTDLEGQMTPLWAGWPAASRQVGALRQAVEAAGRSALPAAPSLTATQVRQVRALLARFDSAGAREVRVRAALDRWAGPGLDGARLGQLVSGPLPAEITQALEAWTRSSLPTDLPTDLSVQTERAQVQAAVQAEKDRSAAVLGPLRALQEQARAVRQAEHELARASGAALPRAQRRLYDVRQAYAAQAAALGFSPAPSLRRIETLIEEELAAFNRRLQPLDAQWKALVNRPAPASAPPALPGGWKRAWAAVSSRHGLPLHPDTWARSLWPRRAEGEQLWAELEDARREQQAAQDDLAALCASWPAGARTVAALRQAAWLTGMGTLPAPALPDRPLSNRLPRNPPAPAAPTRPPVPVPDAPRAAPASPARSAPTAPPLPEQSPATAPSVAQATARRPVPPLPVQPTPVRPAPVARPSVPSVAVQNVAAPSPVLRPVPLPPVAPAMQTGPVVIPPVPPAARETLPLTTPALSLPSPVSPAPVRPPSVTPSPVTPPPMPTTPPPRPLAGPGPSQPVVRPAPLLPPVRGVPLPPVPAARPSTPEPGEPPPEPATGRLTRRQRAEREAVRISDQYDWEQGFHLIADALDRDRWGQLRESIEREIARGMTPDEFELLLQLRAYWHDQTHYQSPYTARYDSLPWELGIALIRRCAGVPCLDDMILLLERLYEYAQVACSPRSLPAFSQRLGAILDRAEPDVDLDYWLSTREGR